MSQDAGKEDLYRRIALVKAALGLGDTITKITGIRLEPCSYGAKACCPFHRESTPSFYVNESTGRYKCFGAGCGVSGDVIQFLGDWYSIGFREALKLAGELACLPESIPASGWPGLPPPVDHQAWSAAISGARRNEPALRPASAFLQPVPGHVALPEPGQKVSVLDPVRKRVIRLVPSHVHRYCQPDGSTLCLVLRSRARNGRKFFIQAAWNNEPGKQGWVLARFPRDVARPVYGLEGIPGWQAVGGVGVLLVDGEKTRDAATQLLPTRKTGLLALSAMGGGNAARLADWSPLANACAAMGNASRPTIEVIVWPDADQPTEDRNGSLRNRQLHFAHAIAATIGKSLSSLGVSARYSRILPPEGSDNGWDLADALEQGWTIGRALAHLKEFRVPLDTPKSPAPQLRPNPIPEARQNFEPEVGPIQADLPAPAAIGTQIRPAALELPLRQSGQMEATPDFSLGSA